MNIDLKKTAVCAVLAVTALSVVGKMAYLSDSEEMKKKLETEESYFQLEKMLSMKKNNAVVPGDIYGINGECLTELCESDDMPSAKERAFSAPVELAENGAMNILLSGSLPENKRKMKGCSIQTTIHPDGQRTAYSEVSAYTNNADGAQLAVVLPDGAVLVYAAAGSTSPAPPIGSSSKALYSRLYTLPEFREDSQYDIAAMYTDYNVTVINGRAIFNHDGNDSMFDISPYYPQYEGEIVNADGVSHSLRSRQVDLELAAVNSSNGYFIDHADHFGFQKVVDALNRVYGFDKPMRSDIFELGAVTNDDSAADVDLFFGQSMQVPPIRTAATMNAAMTGKLNMPFLAARVISPNDTEIYRAAPKTVITTEDISVDPQNDIVVNALKSCYTSYIGGEYVGRIASKSGTSENGDGTETRTMLVSLFTDTQPQELICSAVIVVEHSYTENQPYSDALLQSLINVFGSMGML